MAEITIKLRPNGPLVIDSSAAPGVTLRVVDHLGNPFPLPVNKPMVALCRCGHSAIKPFCDGAHKVCGFLAEELAAPPAAPSETPPTGPA
jgi:CDGSH-type Zn-finger protein